MAEEEGPVEDGTVEAVEVEDVVVEIAVEEDAVAAFETGVSFFIAILVFFFLCVFFFPVLWEAGESISEKFLPIPFLFGVVCRMEKYIYYIYYLNYNKKTLTSPRSP